MSEERFHALYGNTARDLLGYFIRRTETPEEAADCLAETLLVAWRKHDEIPSDEAQARPWVFGVARNVLRRAREQDHKRSEVVDALASELRDARATIPTDDPGMLTDTLDGDDDVIVDGDRGDERPNDRRGRGPVMTGNEGGRVRGARGGASRV